MDIKRGLKKCVDEMNIPEAESVLPEGVSSSGERDEKKAGHRSRRYVSYACAGIAVAASAAVCVFMWQPWKEVSNYDLYVGNAMDDATPPDESLTANAESASDDELKDSESSDVTVSEESMSDEEISESENTESESKKDYDESASAEASAESNNDSKYNDGVIYDGGATSETGASSTGASTEGVVSDATSDRAAVVSEEAAWSYSDTDDVDGEYYDYISETNDVDPVAGTITGGEICDLRDFASWNEWISYFSEEYMGQWNMVLRNRVTVYLHNGDVALNDVNVRLMQGDTVLYEAVTDVNGNAYLFYGYVLGSQDSPTAVCVENADGEWVSYDYGENLDIDMEGENDPIKVDLMFVVDTTGSMSDELAYLQVEIQDVIERVETETGASIRTSVNFYRDEGDEYVVKYYDFRDDAAEVSSLVAEQSASGGGDEPEAVHTALNNALNEHDWSDDSTVKLMFLVLDAPPHDDDEIKAEILSLTEQAAAMGVRIIPVAASGADEYTQQLLRGMAIMTGGTFIFLDDNSGVGYSHTVTETDYTSEYLNEMMIRIIAGYCGVTIETEPAEEVTATIVDEQNDNAR